MLTDSHCHLASPRFADDGPEAIITRARDAGVTRIVTLATTLDDLAANLRLAETHSGVRACAGIHPCDVAEAPDDVIDRLRAELGRPGLAAVGETGLDYFHPAPDGWTDAAYRRKQRELLDAHFGLAAEAGLNVVIHTRDRDGDASFRDALEIYRGHADRARAVFHCFVGSFENARAVLDLGGLVSFGGVATFKNAAGVRELTTRLPTSEFMLETDAPYLAPHPHRGTRNEPARIADIADCLAAARGVPKDELAARTTETALGFFRFADD